jgi:hypothetical protein
MKFQPYYTDNSKSFVQKCNPPPPSTKNQKNKQTSKYQNKNGLEKVMSQGEER